MTASSAWAMLLLLAGATSAVAFPVAPGTPRDKMPRRHFDPNIVLAVREAGCIPSGVSGRWTFDVTEMRSENWRPEADSSVVLCVDSVLGDFPDDVTDVVLELPFREN